MAARRGRRPARRSAELLAELRDALTRGWPAGLTTLTGDDLYRLDQAQRELLRALVAPDGTDFGFSVYGEERVDVGTVVAACRSAGMFSPRRVVLVREVGALEGEPDALLAFAAAPPRDSFLLVRAPKLDLRRKLHKALHGAGRLLDFAAADAHDAGQAMRDVADLAAERGLRLSRESAAFLGQACGGDLYRVASELDKLAAGEHGDKPIPLAAVREVAASGGLMSGWEVANAVTVRDGPAALAAARRLVQAGDEPIRIVGGLAFRARALLQARAMRDAGRPVQAIVQATRAWPWADDLRRGLERYTREELLAFPARLLAADRALKSRALAPGAVLESLVRQMTGGAPVEGLRR